MFGWLDIFGVLIGEICEYVVFCLDDFEVLNGVVFVGIGIVFFLSWVVGFLVKVGDLVCLLLLVE